MGYAHIELFFFFGGGVSNIMKGDSTTKSPVPRRKNAPSCFENSV